MSDIRILRPHTLGLIEARRLAGQWAEEIEQAFGMDCTAVEGTTHHVVEFRRSGVEGRLVVEANRFDLSARLGLLLSAFISTIETEIEARLDALLTRNAAVAREPQPQSGSST